MYWSLTGTPLHIVASLYPIDVEVNDRYIASAHIAEPRLIYKVI